MSPADAAPAHADHASPVGFRPFVSLLFTRKWLILAVAFAVEAGMAAAVFWWLLPTYETKARLHIDLQSGAARVIQGNSPSYITDIERLGFFETVMQEIETRSILENVVRRLELADTRALGRFEMIRNWYLDTRVDLGTRYGIASWQKRRDPFAASVAAVGDNLATSRLENSTILELVYNAHSAAEAQDTLRILIEEYIAFRNTFARERAAGSSDFLRAERDRVRAEIVVLEQRWLDVMKEDAFALTPAATAASEGGGSAPGTVDPAADVTPTDRTVVGLLGNQQVVDEMRVKLIALQEELERVLALNNESHPIVPRLRELIASYATAINRAPALHLEMRRLQRELDVKEKMYTELVSAYQNTVTMESEDLRRLNIVKVIQAPDLPGGHKSPMRLLALTTGAPLGLILGVLFALIVEFLNGTVKSSDDVRRLGLAHVASLQKT
jgi:uncharacterized protein involved in exopolysaccharide biosynthesis